MKWTDTSYSLASAFVVTLAVIAAVGYLSLNNIQMLSTSHHSTLRHAEIADQIDRLLYAVKDAESNSRTYVITGDPSYLEQFRQAPRKIAEYRNNLELLFSGDSSKRARLTVIDSLIAGKMSSMNERVQAFRVRGLEEVKKLYLPGTGTRWMDAIVEHVREVEADELNLQREEDLRLRSNFAKDVAQDAVLTGVTALITILFFFVASRQFSLRRKSENALLLSETRFRSLIENSADGVLLLDLNGKILYVNPAGRVLLDRPDKDIIGRQSLEFIHPEDTEAAGRKFLELNRNGVKLITMEFRIRRNDGSVRWIDARYHRTGFEADREMIIANYRDSTDRKRSEIALLESEERYRAASVRLQHLSERLLSIQETERRELAVELHDEIGQLLTALQINLHAIRQGAGATQAAQLEESISVVDRLSSQVRNLSLELRPSVLDHLGLLPALRWYVDKKAQVGGLDAEVRADFEPRRFPSVVETACFRVVQEAITNILRHAGAHTIMLSLTMASGRLNVHITDDGKGFAMDEAQKKMEAGLSMGIVGMKERVELAGGEFRIESQPAKGTTIVVTMPIDDVTHPAD